MFNTGDIVSWREDGLLNTFGREDDQVKIKVKITYVPNSLTDLIRAFESS
jgi:non-ribosomal peptide synthetase component F